MILSNITELSLHEATMVRIQSLIMPHSNTYSKDNREYYTNTSRYTRMANRCSRNTIQ